MKKLSCLFRVNFIQRISLLLPIVLFFVAGCAILQDVDSLLSDTLIFDPIPHEVDKGYIEFLDLERIGDVTAYEGHTYILRKQEFGRKVAVQGSVVWSVKQRQLFAERPGKHTFYIQFGTAKKTVPINVVQGMITPVEISVEQIGVGVGEDGKSRPRFKLTVELEPPETADHLENSIPLEAMGSPVYDLDQETVFQAALKAAKKMGWEIRSISESNTAIFAEIPKGAFYLRREISIGVEKTPEGKTQVPVYFRMVEGYRSGRSFLGDIMEYYDTLNGLLGED